MRIRNSKGLSAVWFRKPLLNYSLLQHILSLYHLDENPLATPFFHIFILVMIHYYPFMYSSVERELMDFITYDSDKHLMESKNLKSPGLLLHQEVVTKIALFLIFYLWALYFPHGQAGALSLNL